MDVTDQEMEEVVEAWVAHRAAEDKSPERERTWWAVSLVMDWSLEHRGDLLWRFILAAYPRDLPPKAVAVLAAGPLEELLSDHGPAYIEAVESLARKDPRFNHLLGGVWRLSMPDDVWARVQAARREVW
jgi:hypothetical protein